MKSWMVLATLVAFTPPGHAQHAASASNMALLGHHDLQGRSAYQPVIHEQNGRWIAYVGHHGGGAPDSLPRRGEESGASIGHVSDPPQPPPLPPTPRGAGPARSRRGPEGRGWSGQEPPQN